MADQAKTIGAPALCDFVARLFQSRGMTALDAQTVAQVLVWADQRGADTHGVSRIAHYFGMIDKGAMQPQAVPLMRADFGAVFSLDAQGAAGPIAMRELVKTVQQRARQFGIGLGTMGRSTHVGAIGFYAEQVAQQGFATIVFAAGPPLMAYEGARTASLSTAPLAIAVPGGPDGVVLLDMASSLVSNGRLKKARRDGEILPEGWALDGQGKPAREASQAEVLLPMAGPKGSGLALMIEMLTSLLASAPLLAPLLQQGKKGHGQSVTLIAIDVARLRVLSDFQSDMDVLTQLIKALPRLEGVSEIRLPGERSHQIAKTTAAQGLVIDPKVWKELQNLADVHGVAMPDLT